MNRNFTPYIYILIFLGLIQNSLSQNFELKLVAIDSLENSILNRVTFQKSHPSDEVIISELDSVVLRLQKQGFINTTIDSIQKNEQFRTAYFSLNQKFNIVRIYYDEKIISRSKINSISNTITDKYFEVKIDDLEQSMRFLVSLFEESGKSFTRVNLTDVHQNNEMLMAKLELTISNQRYIDDIVIKGYDEFPKAFTEYFLDLKKESIFNTQKLEKASNALNMLSFARETKAPDVLFTNDSTIVYLNVEKLKSNRFDGLIGFSTDDNGKLEFNGYLDLLLQNVLNKGEMLSIQWKSNADDRKTFNLALETPYIFNTPVSPSIYLNIYKQDSTFINVKTNLNLGYAINQNNSIHANYQSENSNDLSSEVNNQAIEEFKNSYLGLTYTHKTPDKDIALQYKFYASLNALWGNRTISIENSKQSQHRYKLNLYYNWKLNRRNYIFIKTDNALLFSEDLYENELYRIGGSNSIRGFNEESIFASAYSILNLEYRYFIATSSYLYSITDFAYTQNDVINYETQLYSLGLGYAYNTNNGLVDISYAIGKAEDIPFDFQNSKFHIRFVQFF